MSDRLNNVYVNRAMLFSATFADQPLLSNEPYVLMPGFSLGDLVWRDTNRNGVFDSWRRPARRRADRGARRDTASSSPPRRPRATAAGWSKRCRPAPIGHGSPPPAFAPASRSTLLRQHRRVQRVPRRQRVGRQQQHAPAGRQRRRDTLAGGERPDQHAGDPRPTRTRAGGVITGAGGPLGDNGRPARQPAHSRRVHQPHRRPGTGPARRTDHRDDDQCRRLLRRRDRHAAPKGSTEP